MRNALLAYIIKIITSNWCTYIRTESKYREAAEVLVWNIISLYILKKIEVFCIYNYMYIEKPLAAVFLPQSIKWQSALFSLFWQFWFVCLCGARSAPPTFFPPPNVLCNFTYMWNKHIRYMRRYGVKYIYICVWCGVCRTTTAKQTHARTRKRTKWTFQLRLPRLNKLFTKRYE